jgi:hypothetical protein
MGYHSVLYGLDRYTMSRRMRVTRQRQRSVNNSIRLQKKKSLLEQQWQATQIQIWHSMNEQDLAQEKILKKVSQPIDKPEVKLL